MFNKQIINRGLLFSSPLFLTLFFFIGCRQATPNNENPSEFITEVAYPFEAGSSKLRQISAHRGGGDISGYPENCLESIKYIHEKTGAWMEIDIRSTKDAHLILMHDAAVDRTTNGHGKVETLTLSEIKNLDLKDNNGRLTAFHPPTLEEVLIWNEGKGNTVINLDIKQGVQYEDLLSLVRKTNQLDNVVAIVYTIGQAKAMRRLDSDIVISLPVRSMEEWQRLKKSGLPLEKLIAFTGTIRSSKELYDTLRQNKMLAIFGVMGNIDRQAAKRGSKVYDQLYLDGADILSTDRPLDVR